MSFSYAEVEESKFRSLLSCGVPDNCSYKDNVKQKEFSLKYLGKMFVWKDIPERLLPSLSSTSLAHYAENRTFEVPARSK